MAKIRNRQIIRQTISERILIVIVIDKFLINKFFILLIILIIRSHECINYYAIV